MMTRRRLAAVLDVATDDAQIAGEVAGYAAAERDFARVLACAIRAQTADAKFAVDPEAKAGHRIAAALLADVARDCDLTLPDLDTGASA